MATRRTSFEKRERERAKKAKAAAKQERRVERSSGTDEEPEEVVTTTGVDQDKLLADLAELHRAFDDEELDLDTFEERKAELMAQLHVD